MKQSFIQILQKKGMLFLCLIGFAISSQGVCANVASKADKAKEGIAISSISEETQKKLEKDWGIRVVGLRSTMTGMMVDFRYKVLDAKKAATLLDINKQSYLIVEKNKARLGVPNSVKIGALRQTTHAKKVKPGRDYFILFGNPGAKYIKPGDKATLVVGDLKIEHMILL